MTLTRTQRASPRSGSGKWATRALVLAVALLGASQGPGVHAQGCSANPVVCENQLGGTPSSQWDISGAGDSTLQGFATDISVNKGQTINFKIDTTASSFTINIYRLGYYGGNGARLIATIPNVPGVDQPNCLTDSRTGLIDCGNWSVSASWAVPVTAVSGVYLARLSRSNGGASHIPFVVRDDQRAAPVLFQTSDTTWQAYNTYGGNSLYAGGPGSNPSRAYKVSYNRPITTRGASAADFLFAAEYPMIRFLEANGFDVTYAAGVDTDRAGTSALLQHQTFVSTGHDEYWSGQQRANVESARQSGLNLAFFSGNEVFWKTRWETSIDGSGTPYRTMVCYKETHASAKIDPADPPTWTGTWMDPRFSPPADGGRPQNALTGTLFMINAGAPSNASLAIKVPQTYASQPFWRNTSVARLSSGQTATLAPGTLAYEWDENVNNGSRPAGLTQLSSATYSNMSVLQDYGSTYATASATHAMTLYHATSGALVFGAGTCLYAWGLDGHHDFSNVASTTNLAMQQATINLLSDMGVQPGSLQSGLVLGTSDVAPPTVSLTAPGNGATVSGGVTLSATASDNVAVAGVDFDVDGVSLGTLATTAPYQLTWNSATVSNGTHTITAIARDTSGNSTTSAPISVTVSNAVVTGTGPLAIDATASADRSTSKSSIATAAFTTHSANELLLAFVSADDVRAGNTVTSVSGGGLTWQLVIRTNAQRGDAEVWRAWAGNPLSNVTVTGTLAQSAAASISVVTFTGADATGTYGSGAIGAIRSASASSGAPSGTVTTTRDNSWVFGVGTDWDGNTARTLGASQTMVHQYLASVGDAYWVQRQNATTPTAGTPVTINDTAPTGDGYNLSIVEVLPAASTGDTPPTVAITAPSAAATVSDSVTITADASDNIAVAGVQFLVDGSPLGAADTVLPYSVTWDTTSATNGAHALTAVATDSSGNIATSPTVNVTVSNSVGLTCPCSLWSSSTVPGPVEADPSAVELGMKFTSDTSGYITGLRFYKYSQNTGTHVGNLWTSSGTLLATVTFANETASGWQQATFASPVAISPNTVYVISYHTNTGYYAVTEPGFTSSVDAAPLHALANSTSANGVFQYGSSSAFPNQTWDSSNYWVDVIFATSVP